MADYLNLLALGEAIPKRGVTNPVSPGEGSADLHHLNMTRLLSMTSETSSLSSENMTEREDNDDSSYFSKKAAFPGRAPLRSMDSGSSLESLGFKSSWRSWDVFRVINKVKSATLDEHVVSRCRKALKVAFGLALAMVVLVSALVSKTTLLVVASNIYVNVTWFCHHHPGDRHLTSCARDRPDRPEADIHQIFQNVDVRWMWSMYGLVVTPYLLTFIKCAWRMCFKKCRNPTWRVFFVVFLCESLHSLGLSILAFKILPQMDSLRALLLTLGVAFVPSLLKLFDKMEEHGRSVWTYIVDVLAIIAQASILLLWPVHYFLIHLSSAESWAIPISLLLLSLGHWENYINKYSSLGTLGTKLKELKKSTRRTRTKIYIVVVVWKVGLTLALMTAIMSEFHSGCANVIFFLGDGAESECPHLNYPFGVSIINEQEDLGEPYWVMLVQMSACLLCYTLAKTACKTLLQVAAFAVPLTLVLPVIVGTLMQGCQVWTGNSSEPHLYLPTYLARNCETEEESSHYLATLLSEFYLPVGVAWWLSFVWVTCHIWFPRVEKLAQTERLFVQVLYCGVLLEQCLLLNRRRDDKDKETRSEQKQALQFFQEQQEREIQAGLKPRGSLRTDITPMIYVCATMWHETEKEMILMLTSVFRLDLDQCTRKHAFVFFDVVDSSYYEFEAHIFFDDAFEPHAENELEYQVNVFVRLLVKIMDTAASAVHRVQVKMGPPLKISTPYGGRLEWILPGRNKLSVHLKDKVKIRHKKRWSQVMYMYYLLGHRLVAQRQLDARRKQTIADNTYLLALDGDVDFQPSAVQLLVDRMRKNERVGAACGRIHPVGSGPIVWYQKFEYAVSHWLQKATEHMIGCVLCSPGCFSLFRASALMDDNVMRKYATTSTEARHYVQYDQGEDRWLCTLLLQQGYRVEYCAAADAQTYCPEGFNEFYNQRLRWTPSTLANIMDLLTSWRLLIRKNENFSALYVIYQLLLFVSSLLTPATTFLLIVGAFSAAFKEVSLVEALFINLVPVLTFLLLCLFTKTKVQLPVAGALSIAYALLMMIVVVGLVLEMKKDGLCAPTTAFTLCVSAIFIISALLHPLEFLNLFHGLVYLLAVPSMSMLLMIYSITNLDVVSWGTREVTPAQHQADDKKPRTTNNDMLKAFTRMFQLKSGGDNEGSDYGFSCGNLFRCVCCPRSRPETETVQVATILDTLNRIEESISRIREPSNLKSGHNIEEGQETKEPITSLPQTSTNEQTTHSGTPQLREGRENRNPEHQKAQSPCEEDFTPRWMQDTEHLGRGNIRYLGSEEAIFWRELIEKYLYPLVLDSQQQQKITEDLRHLRNKFSLMFFLLNALFIVIIFAMQYTNAAEQGEGLAIPLPCTNSDGRNLTLEPISLLFMCVFGVALLVQFLAMFLHRMGTFLHIISSTEVNCMRMNKSELAALDVSDKLELVHQMQTFEDEDEDTAAEESLSHTDDSPQLCRRRTVIRLARKRRIQELRGSNFVNKFMERYLKLAKDLHQEKVRDRSKNCRGSAKRKAFRAIESISKSNKNSMLLKAHKWRSIHRGHTSQITLHNGVVPADNNQENDPRTPAMTDQFKNDPWVTLVRGVMSHSTTSLNVAVEEEERYVAGRRRPLRESSCSCNYARKRPALLLDQERLANRAGFAGPNSLLKNFSAAGQGDDVSQTYITGLGCDRGSKKSITRLSSLVFERALSAKVDKQHSNTPSDLA